MFFKFLKSFLFVTLFALFAVSVNAQLDASTPSGIPRSEDLPKSIRENLAKGRIEQEKKEYEALIKRGEEALKLSEELEKSFSENNKLSSDDRKKLEKLEKLVKKIRTELGADEDDVSEESTPSTLENAFKSLQENTSKLMSELKKSTRYTVSVVAIKSSNVLLKVVKFLRFAN